jgi:beta-glucanase (GH16 family)
MIVAFLVLAAQSAFTVSNSVYTGPLKRPASARIVWRDEFNGHALDLRKWRYDTAFNKQGWFNRELQYYSAGWPQNLRLASGRLIITARHETPSSAPDWGGQHYTSGKIVSNRAWTYGFYEIRAKLPCGRGTWPAIWMLPQHMKKWPDDGEIDIMEHVGWKPHEIVSSLHTGLFNFTIKTQRSAQRVISTSCDSLHVYQLDWRPDSITIGIDGHGILRVLNNQPGEKGAWPFNVPFQMILNLAIGGDWGGAMGIDDQAMPQRLEVDYVRVWQVRR